MPKQQSFKNLGKPDLSFGGSKLKGNPKRKRPLASKLPIHLTVKATRSLMRLPINFAKTNQIVRETAKRYGITIYIYANVGNHLHALIKLPHVNRWAAFIRELTGRLALAMGIKWLYRPFTRVVAGWGRAFRVVKQYIYLNQLEGAGLGRFRLDRRTAPRNGPTRATIR